MKYTLHTITSIILIVALTGCSAFRPHYQTVTVTASEPQAQIWINSKFEGVTPVQKDVQRNRSVSILIRKEGFEPATRTIDKHLSTTAILDIVGLFFILVPSIGLLTPGAWDLDETDIFVQLFPDTNGVPAAAIEEPAVVDTGDKLLW